jgi:hypothetical protein
MGTNIVGGERRFPDIVASNYTDLSTNFPPALYTNQYAEVINSQGTSWLPGIIGGTYYSKGFYKSDGVIWDYVGSFPYQATQAQVDAGTNNDRFVTPSTLRNSSQWDDKLDVSAISSNLILYATSAASDVAGYFKLVTSPSDIDYDSPAIDVPTGPITGTGQLIASLITSAGLINGNPGIINLVTTGNIRRTTNNGSGDFYYEVYLRDSGGTETLIATSSNTANVINMSYEQFYAPALLNNGSFGPTDRVVIKYYGNKTSSATPEYEFQFGGSQPVRTLLPIPITASFSGGGTWGSIGGVLSNQTDLQTALNGKQNIPTLAATDVTAVNNEIYNNVGTVTYTDPAPVTGRGYTVNVVSGTATVGATAYAVAGTRLLRIYDGASWNTRVLSGTNTGDETQSSILTKLGWFKIIDTTDSATLTGVSTETIMKAVQLPTLTDGSKFKINDLRVTKAGVATCTIRGYINNVDDNLSGAVQILTSGAAIPAGSQIATMERTFKISSGNIKGTNAATGVFTDKGQTSATPLNATLPTGTLYLIVTLQQAVGESSQVELIDISNF